MIIEVVDNKEAPLSMDQKGHCLETSLDIFPAVPPRYNQDKRVGIISISAANKLTLLDREWDSMSPEKVSIKNEERC